MTLIDLIGGSVYPTEREMLNASDVCIQLACRKLLECLHMSRFLCVCLYGRRDLSNCQIIFCLSINIRVCLYVCQVFSQRRLKRKCVYIY